MSQGRHLAVAVAFSAAGALVAVIVAQFLDFRPAPPVLSAMPAAAEAAGEPLFMPPRPEDAPGEIRERVLSGQRIMSETRTYAGPYVGNRLSCSSCHFEGGATRGGKNGGISLVGVSAIYPRYRARQGEAVDLVTRTNDCFERSMNGRRLPPESIEMKSLMAYYHWLSKGVPIYASVPWLGAPREAGVKGDGVRGRRLFAGRCAACHGGSGEGTEIASPLWGAQSFNDGAGMSKPEVFAGFVGANMPRGDPQLSKAEAADIAAYVGAQPRPKFRAP